jgi:hypothetical protein
MTNRIVSFSPSSTFLTYVAIFHLHMVFVSRSWFGMQELVRHTIQFRLQAATYDQFLIWVSLLTNTLMSRGFLQSRLQAAFCKFYGGYNNLVCQYNLPLGQVLSDVFHECRSLRRYWHADLDCSSCRLLDLEVGLMAGVAGRRGMLAPPGHLVPPLVYPEIVFPTGLMRSMTVRYLWHYIIIKKYITLKQDGLFHNPTQ